MASYSNLWQLFPAGTRVVVASTAGHYGGKIVHTDTVGVSLSGVELIDPDTGTEPVSALVFFPWSNVGLLAASPEEA